MDLTLASSNTKKAHTVYLYSYSQVLANPHVHLDVTKLLVMVKAHIDGCGFPVFDVFLEHTSNTGHQNPIDFN